MLHIIDLEVVGRILKEVLHIIDLEVAGRILKEVLRIVAIGQSFMAAIRKLVVEVPLLWVKLCFIGHIVKVDSITANLEVIHPIAAVQVADHIVPHHLEDFVTSFTAIVVRV